MNHITAIGYDTEEQYKHACILAEQYHFTIDNHVLPRLCVMPDKLVLMSDDFLPLSVDFNGLSVQKRRDAGKKQGLIRACKPAKGIRILDTTAGWGRDAAVLASFGAQVLMLERQALMAALLQDGLDRFKQQPAQQLALLHQDAKQYLQELSVCDYPDVIYIDPMHPTRQKSALVKKDMQVLQQLFGADNDVSELIELALVRAKARVVVKWPQRLPPLLSPDLSVDGKTVRFDIYLKRG